MSAFNPGNGVFLMRERPKVVRVRFSPMSGTTSAMVPRATSEMRSIMRLRNGVGRLPELGSRLWCMRANCHASLKATPAPQRSPKG